MNTVKGRGWLATAVLALGLATPLSAQVPVPANHWSGTGSWSEVSHWSLGHAPTPTELAVFDGTSGNCTIDGNVSCTGIQLTSTYNGIITASGNLTLGSLGASLAGGSFFGGAGTIIIQGPLLISGTNFTSTLGELRLEGDFSVTSGNFSHNNGTVVFAKNVVMPQSFSVQVSSSTDDAEERPNGGMYITSSDLEMTVGDDYNQKIGIRFPNVALPPNASGFQAFLRFSAKTSDSGPSSLILYGQKSLNASTFASNSWNIGSRPVTDAFVVWNPTPWTASSEYSVDVTSLVQEIVSQAQWNSGNALAIIIRNYNGILGTRRAWAYNGSTSQAPRLDVQYSQPVIATQQLHSTAHFYNMRVDSATTRVRLQTPLIVDGTLTVAQGTLTSSQPLTQITAATVTVTGQGAIDLNGLGGSQGMSPGLPSGPGGGGSGGAGGGVGGGAAYGPGVSYDVPGSVSGSGAPGGGALNLLVSGTLTLYGMIRSDGATGAAGGGGSVWIQAGTLTGNGQLFASGGMGTAGGGGGGGRIRILANTNSFAGTISAWPGNGYPAGGAGTVANLSLIATTSATTGGTLSWSYSAPSFQVFIGSAPITTTSTSITLGGLTNGVTYSWYVVALDSSGNPVATSLPSDFTFDASMVSPFVPTGLSVANVGSLQPLFTATFSDPNGDPLNQVEVEVNGITVGGNSLPLAYSGPALAWGTTYSWRIRMSDPTNYWSSWSASSSFTTPMQWTFSGAGWYEALNPFPAPMDWNAVSLEAMEPTYYVSDPSVPGGWRWYNRYDHSRFPADWSDAGMIQPGQTFWVRAKQAGATVTAPVPGGPISSTANPPTTVNAWRMEIRVQAAGLADGSAVVGVHPLASAAQDDYDVLQMAAGGPLRVSSGDLAQDVRSTVLDPGATIDWAVSVQAPTGTSVTISVPNIAQLSPSDWMLQVLDGGVATNLLSNYTFLAPKVLTIRATRVTGLVGSLAVSAGEKNPAGGTIAAGTATLAMAQIKLEAQVETIVVSKLRLRGQGTADEAAAVASVFLYQDEDGDGDGDTVIGTSKQFAADDGEIEFAGLAETIAANSTVRWVVVYVLYPWIAPGATLRVTILPSSIEGTGLSTGLALTGSGAAISGGESTVDATVLSHSESSGGGGGGGCSAPIGGRPVVDWSLWCLVVFVAVSLLRRRRSQEAV